MIVLKDENSKNRVDILGITTDDLNLIKKGVETLLETDMEFDRIRLNKLLWDINDGVIGYKSNSEKIRLYGPEGKNIYRTVDLGLPSGLKWADSNIGADSPEQAGLYFAWGGTAGYSLEMTKKEPVVAVDENCIRWEISDKFILDMDITKLYMGGKWRMPTKDEFDELTDCCRSEMVCNYRGSGVNGLLLTSCANGNSIFLPAAGCCGEGQEMSLGTMGCYWSSSFFDKDNSWILSFKNGIIDTQIFKRCDGLPVRAVMKD